MSFFQSDTAYDNFMGRYSTRLAAPFADFAGIHGGSVVDVGAGTGALTAELLRRGATVAAAEPAPAFAEALRVRHADIDVRDAPAEELPWEDGQFDAALAQLVVSFMRDAPTGVAEMRRVVRPGGTVAVCMWDMEGMEMLAVVRRARTALADGEAPVGPGMDYRRREEIESLFTEGFADVTTELLEVDSTYSGFGEFWDALAGGAGPAGAWAVSLTGEARDSAQAELHRQLGSPDGPFTLTGRAWATRGTRA